MRSFRDEDRIESNFMLIEKVHREAVNERK